MQDRADAANHGGFDRPDLAAAGAVERFADRRLLLLTDFDGTLSEVAMTPDEATMSSFVRDSFASLAGLPDVTLGVVSGRTMSDVAARIGPSAEFVAGLHGLEIVGPGVSFRHQALDAVESVIARLAADAARQLAWCPGVLLENKGSALTCHVRQAPADLGEHVLEEFEALAEPFLEGGVLKLLIGRRAMELLPAVDWHKGRAVEWIRRRVGDRAGRPVAVMYLGDDRTDEDAFTSLVDGDMAVGVGSRPHSHMIDLRLEGPAAVGQFFTAFKAGTTGGDARRT